MSITFDEPIHFVCGLEYLSKHVYRYETQHPPLERAAGAFLPYLDGYRTIGKATATEEAIEQLQPGPRTDRLLVRMRAGVLPFFAAAIVVVFLWTRRYFGPAAAVLATLVFTSIPPVLAHAGVATTDIALTAWLCASFYCLLRWAETPKLRWAIPLGVCTGLSVLSKFTTLIYLPAATVLACCAFVAMRRPGLAGLRAALRPRLATFAAAVAAGALVIWAGYFFSFGPVPSWHAAVKVPAPELFDGINAVRSHDKVGHLGYLLGERSYVGWWYFFPVVLSVKTPISILLLFLAGVGGVRLRRSLSGWLVLAFMAGVLLSAMAGHINIGVRHVLPLYAGMSIIAGVGLARIAEWMGGRAAAAVVVCLLVVWVAAPAIKSHPDYLAYTNEIAGDHPEEIIADSDLDWGQEFKRLGKFLKQRGATTVTLHLYDSAFTANDFMQKQYGFPTITPFVNDLPNEGWSAIGATRVALDTGWKRHEKLERHTGSLAILNPAWYTTMYPTERLGGLLLYNIPPNLIPQ